MSEWISVKDRLPEIDVYCLAYFSAFDIEVLRHNGDYWTRKAWPKGYQPTHWMPLPKAPN